MNGTSGGSLDDTEERLWRSLGVEPRHHDVVLPRLGTTAHVTEIGDPSDPPVVFVHGGSVAGPSWADLVARLGHLRCLLVDRPGCGRSEPIPSDGADGLLRVMDTLVVDVVDGLGLGRVSVVGTSYGGAFALRAAATHPGRVDRLVLIAWCLGMPGTSAPMWLRIGSLPGLRRLNGVVAPTPQVVRALLSRFGMRRAVAEGRFSDEAIDWLVALLGGTDTLRHEAATAGPVVSLRRGWDPRLTWPDVVVAAVAAPTLLLIGDEDPFGTPAAARSLAERMADAHVEVVTAAGHAPWLDRLDTCAQAISDHLTAPTRA